MSSKGTAFCGPSPAVLQGHEGFSTMLKHNTGGGFNQVVVSTRLSNDEHAHVLTGSCLLCGSTPALHTDHQCNTNSPISVPSAGHRIRNFTGTGWRRSEMSAVVAPAKGS